TQNPIESEGVYQLPEAQRDRFMMKITMTHPSADEEMTIVDRMSVSPPVADQVIDLDGLADLQKRAAGVFIDRSVQQYAVDLVQATRTPAQAGMADLAAVIALGASPRATLALVRGAKALALLRGRTYATPQEIFDLAPEVLRHRLILTYDALARDISIEHVLSRVLSTVPTMWVSPKPNDSSWRS
ncbi:MAG: MoxR family ATPase, partial [Ilumatobacteraceae bacterium]